MRNLSIIAVIIILIISFLLYRQIVNNEELKDKYQVEVNLKNALLDSIKYYRNKEKEWVAEKLSIQESIKNLENINDKLTTSQKELLFRIKEIEKNSSIIAAALIETNVKIDELKQPNVMVSDSSVTFNDSTKNLKYNIEIGHVKPIIPEIQPTLKFNKFELPNKQFIEFHWKNDRKKGYPIAFSVSNSNDYFKITNIDSYVIPNLKKKDVSPNGWDRFIKWTKNNGKVITYIGIGAIGGITTFWLFSK